MDSISNSDNDILEMELTVEDMEELEGYWDQIVPTVSYLGTEAVAKVYEALNVAFRAHRGQRRKSGEPFIIHPVSVALLLADLKMDADTVMAGLLHDTVEDTELTFSQIESCFGHTVKTLVEGETKVSKLPTLLTTNQTPDEQQAENLRQMFVAMTDDYRIIIVKLADRLHNMRTLQHMKPHKIKRISRETLDIFAPLAHRMGIWHFKSEMEDIAFRYLYPEAYVGLKERLEQHQTKLKETLDATQLALQRVLSSDHTLRQQAANVEVSGRTKELYSLWHKMETKDVQSLENIVDVVALRVILTPLPEEEDDMEETAYNNEADRGVWLCYHVLGLVQHLPGFTPVPTRVKDYISFPKPNGYQSLHTALILNGQTVEVQIRTSAMHRVAEYGMASHWAYTDEKRRTSNANPEFYTTPWLSSIKEWQNDRISSQDFVDSVRRELLGKRVFVFLRNGKILNLARGATAIDAAFQIHTEVGLGMHGVLINGKPVPFSYELQNGDVVSIQTGEGKPATDWMRYAKSRSTRAKLRSYFRARQKESLKEAGNILLMDYLSIHHNLIVEESHLQQGFAIPRTAEEFAPLLPGKTRYETVNELLVGVGALPNRDMLHKLMSQLFEVPKSKLIEAEEERSGVPPAVAEAVHEQRKHAFHTAHAISASIQHSSELDDSLLSNAAMEKLLNGLGLVEEAADPEHICGDCLPIWGDQIVGTRKEGSPESAMVHRLGCTSAQHSINLAQAKLRGGNAGTTPLNIDSVSLRRLGGYFWRPKKKEETILPQVTEHVPVKLKWSTNDVDLHHLYFLTEIVVHCLDRKLLLADCSEVVSDTVEIVRTGSLTTQEHATLVFLVRVEGVHQLQQLMDRLRIVESVMSVERRFGSELM